jgi:hypothetical protein
MVVLPSCRLLPPFDDKVPVIVPDDDGRWKLRVLPGVLRAMDTTERDAATRRGDDNAAAETINALVARVGVKSDASADWPEHEPVTLT